MRNFQVVRIEDISGVSGTGQVAEGTQFHDGQCVISWYGQHHVMEVAPTIEAWLAIHGHNGSTRIAWQVETELPRYKTDANWQTCEQGEREMVREEGEAHPVVCISFTDLLVKLCRKYKMEPADHLKNFH